MDASRPFSDLCVADFSQGLAGPYCGQLLALYGADVVKVEPLEGDWARPLGKKPRAVSPLFLAVNRGKRSVAIDLKHADGRDIAGRLAAGADVVIESFRPSIADRLGFGHGAVSARNPNVIYVSITGYGQAGPYRDRPATDAILQAFTGMADFNRGKDGAPHKVRTIPIDTAAGMYAFQNVCAALYARERGGGGRRVDVSLMGSAGAFQATRILEYHLDEGDPPPEQYMPVGLYQARDRTIGVATIRQGQFERLCAALDCPELADDPRFASNWDRMRNADALHALLEARLGTRDAAVWSALLVAKGIMSAPANTYTEFLADPHVAAVGAVGWLDQDGIGRVPVVNVPGTDEAALNPRAAPALGAHTAEVLTGLGLGPDDIGRLRGGGIIPAGEG
jgi:crotonobetainyl-CoA:carnitine CoA-transferase CaiB-like acyl-CoA transferase